MAAHAIVEVRNPFFAMLTGDIGLVVFVASIACIRGKRAGMASFALAGSAFPVIDRETVRIVKACWRPSIVVMASCAIHAKQSKVEAWIGVTALTAGGGAFENVIDVTLSALHLCMRPGQRECRKGMVETGIFPILWGMAGGAILTELSLVGVVSGVAGGTRLLRALENIIGVTVVAFDGCMPAFQRKSRLRMIEGHAFPIFRRMACGAVLAKLALVSIVWCMAVETACRCCL